MVELNLALIATAIGIVASIWKFSNSISRFGHSVNDLTKAMEESKVDRISLREKMNLHDIAIERINTQYEDIKEDLSEIKKKVS